VDESSEESARENRRQFAFNSKGEYGLKKAPGGRTGKFKEDKDADG
jgi:hypothetical protein